MKHFKPLIALLIKLAPAEHFGFSRVNRLGKNCTKAVMKRVKNTMLRGFAVLAFFIVAGAPVDDAQARGKKLSTCTNPPLAGKASVYGDNFNGGETSSGEILALTELTAAHPCLPFGTIVQVTDLNTGKTVRVRINDRGPHVKGRIIDLTTAAMKQLGHKKKGVFRVALDIKRLGP